MDAIDRDELEMWNYLTTAALFAVLVALGRLGHYLFERKHDESTDRTLGGNHHGSATGSRGGDVGR